MLDHLAVAVAATVVMCCMQEEANTYQHTLNQTGAVLFVLLMLLQDLKKEQEGSLVVAPVHNWVVDHSQKAVARKVEVVADHKQEELDRRREEEADRSSEEAAAHMVEVAGHSQEVVVDHNQEGVDHSLEEALEATQLE